jgi:hypothetical protein
MSVEEKKDLTLKFNFFGEIKEILPASEPLKFVDILFYISAFILHTLQLRNTVAVT